MTTETNFDLNKADSFEVIPENTVCVLQLKIRAGGAGGANDDGWPKRSADRASEHIDCEYRVLGGDYNGKKLWEARTIRGTLPKHQDAGVFTMRFFRALFESAKGIRPDDKSEAAETARKSVKGWADFNGLCFMARLGVRPPEGTFPAKNTILEVITPERQEWRQPEQSPPTPSSGGAATPVAAAPPPANAITRAEWAK
jgi:hypothetical protein